MKLNTSEKAYLAGIIDGEASISIAKIRTPRDYGKRIYWTYNLHLNIASTNPQIIKWLREKCDAKVYNHRSRKNPGNRQISFSAIWYGQKTKEILKDVYKYLIIKKPHADIALRFPKKINCPAIREKLRLELKKLNLRGQTPEETERRRTKIAFGYATVRTVSINKNAEDSRNDYPALKEVIK